MFLLWAFPYGKDVYEDVKLLGGLESGAREIYLKGASVELNATIAYLGYTYYSSYKGLLRHSLGQ